MTRVLKEHRTQDSLQSLAVHPCNMINGPQSGSSEHLTRLFEIRAVKNKRPPECTGYIPNFTPASLTF